MLFTIDARTIKRSWVKYVFSIWFLFLALGLLKLLLNNWFSGSIQWEVKLEGRIECTAAIVSDFSQVGVQLLIYQVILVQ